MQNSGLVFKGHNVYGIGFVLERQEAHALLTLDPKNEEVLLPYLNGEDLNSAPTQLPDRWVINFRDWSLEKVSRYPHCLKLVHERVKPERDQNARKARREKWWQFGDYASGLESAIAGMKSVIVKSEVGNTVSFAIVPNTLTFSHMLLVFANESPGFFGVLQSSLHEVWARQYGSSMRTDLRYTRSDCVETFPFPSNIQASPLAEIGSTYHEHRRQIMLARLEGLTKTYNRFHDADDTSADIQKLRQLHVEMDLAVAAAYGWTDLDLGHGFHQTKQGLRYTISEPARREVLGRLLKLNHERYAEEVAKGLHEKKKPRTTRKTRTKADESGGLFG